MRTPFEKNDDLVRAAEKRATDQEAAQKTDTKPFRLRWVIVEGQNLPKVDLSDRESLIDCMEASPL